MRGLSVGASDGLLEKLGFLLFEASSMGLELTLGSGLYDGSSEGL